MAEYETRRVDGVTADGRPVTERTVVREEPVVVRRSNNMGWLLALLIIVGLVVAAFAFKLVNIDQISSGSLPKVETTGGSLPKFNVDTAHVDVGTTDTTVKVPTVQTEDKTVKVPTLHVEKADAANK